MRCLILTLALVGCGEAAEPDAPLAICMDIEPSAWQLPGVDTALQAAADNWSVELRLHDDCERKLDVEPLRNAAAMAVAHHSSCVGNICRQASKGIRINATNIHLFSDLPCVSGYRLDTILTHEVGHVLGLPDDETSHAMEPSADECDAPALPTTDELRAAHAYITGTE